MNPLVRETCSLFNMSLERKTFYFDQQPLELWVYFDSQNNIYFKAKEFASFLGYAKPRNAINDNVLESNKIDNKVNRHEVHLLLGL